MLSDVELATVRAALRCWREEICPSGGDMAAYYLDQPTEDFLSESEVGRLERRFANAQVRYVAYAAAASSAATESDWTAPTAVPDEQGRLREIGP